MGECHEEWLGRDMCPFHSGAPISVTEQVMPILEHTHSTCLAVATEVGISPTSDYHLSKDKYKAATDRLPHR
jgi:hypothetical protein